MKILVLGDNAGSSHGPHLAGRSLALSADGHAWVLLNTLPHLERHLRSTPAPWPLARDAIHGVVLMDAQAHHVSGLLGLRDGPPLRLYATPSVFEDLTTHLPILPVLDQCCGVQWHLLPVAGEVHCAPFHVEGLEALQFEAFAIPGPASAYGAHPHDGIVGDIIALRVRDHRTGRQLCYAPGLTELGSPSGTSPHAWLGEADCVITGAAPGIVELLRQAPAQRKVLLVDSVPAHCSAHGIEPAYDGMAIHL